MNIHLLIWFLMTVTKWQIDANPTKLSRDVLVEANSTNILKNKASPGIE